MKKRVFIGVESFKEIIEGDYFYVDKTLFIKELLEKKGKVTLLTRPRRFGKTMNMSMLEHFFDIDKDCGALFDGLNIRGHNEIFDKHLNKYPLVYITLKDVESPSYHQSINKLKIFISSMFQEKLYLYESDKINERQKKDFYAFFDKNVTDEDLQNALRFFTECLYSYHKKQVIVMIDEYDTPIDAAARKGYYTEMVDFMRGFLGGVFKSNKFLEFGVLTGVQRISKESLLSSFNNPKVCGIMSNEFSTSFGFTEDEVKDACDAYEMGNKFDEVIKWYNGYRFGGHDMYNPWSITYFLDQSEFKNYWVNTGGISILQDIFDKGTLNLRNDMARLMTGDSIKMNYVEKIKYPIPYDNDDIFWSMLLNTGYIKPCRGESGDIFKAELVNKEVKNIFNECIYFWFDVKKKDIPKVIIKFVEYLFVGDQNGVSETLNKDLLMNPSCHDFKEENSYHMFIYGMLLAASNDYTVTSNRESGKGRYDCMIKPVDKEKHAVLIEFKHQTEEGCDLKLEARNALEQINEKAYIHTLEQEGYKKVFKYGIAFHKKNCEVAMGSQS